MLHKKAPKPVLIALIFICLALASALFALSGCTSCRNRPEPPSDDSRLPDRCFTKAPPLEKQREIARIAQKRRETTPMVRPAGSVIIPVYFHVLTNADGSEGDVKIDALLNQICVLNAAFAGNDPEDLDNEAADTPFRFVYAGMDKTANDDWFNMTYSLAPTGDEIAAKTTLNQGESSTLNIYTANVADGPFGWTRFPWDFYAGVDGVVVRYTTLPGGTSHPFNLGDIVTHEVGHWLGLFHTFEGACYGDGDFVADTWPEAYAAKLCTSRDSCTDSDFRDPIHNFMDYTPDKCIYEFTPGQSDRMDVMHLEYRTP